MSKKCVRGLVFLLLFSLSSTTVKATAQLDLTKSIYVPAQADPYVKIYTYKIAAPTPFNVTDISGYITFASTLPYVSQTAVALWYSPSGSCPADLSLYTDYPQIVQAFPGAINLDFTNLILSKPGTIDLPTPYHFSVKRPISGCVFLTFDMAASPNASNNPGTGGITTTSHMKLTYDTETAPNPAPFAFPLGAEFCFGTSSGCTRATTCTHDTCAFANVYKVDGNLTLTDLFGNETGGPFSGGQYANPPTGAWNASSDFYLYKSCPNLQAGPNGPADYYSQVPNDATKLVSVPIQSSGNDAIHFPVAKSFAPPIQLVSGNCLVSLTKFSAADGGATIASTVYGLVHTTKLGDFNGDNTVDMSDYNLLVSKFGNPYTIFDYNTLVANFTK